MEGYRSGHNGAVLKTVRAKVHAGSNPAPSAIIPEIVEISGIFIFCATNCATNLESFSRQLSSNSLSTFEDNGIINIAFSVQYK